MVKRFRHILQKCSDGNIGKAAFIAPSIAGISVFFLVPFIETARRSFAQGFGAYSQALGNSAFQLAASNTIKFIGVCIPLLMAASLVLALLVRGVRPNGGLFKSSLLLPMAVPVASVALLWQSLFHENGLMNSLLLALGAQKIDFTGSSAAFWVLIATYLWKNAGYDMILWLAGLDQIPDSRYEAAKIDGAGAWACFVNITLPGLMPTIGLVFMLSLLNSFKVFREAYLVAGPYPHNSIYLLQHLFNNWFTAMDLSRLCAAAVMLALALLAVILPLQRVFGGSK